MAMYTIAQPCAAHVKAALISSRYLLAEDPGQYCGACPNFGKLWSCPPLPESAREFFKKYETATIAGLKVSRAEDGKGDEYFLPEGASDFMRMICEKFTPYLLEAEKLNCGSLALLAGPCAACPDGDCARISGKPCRHPDKMRTSLESRGVNVAEIAKDLFGVEMKWPKKDAPADYFFFVGAILWDKEAALPRLF